MNESEQLKNELVRIKARIKELDYASRSILGRNVLGYRKQSNMTQDELAKCIGCSRVNVTLIERGNSNTSIDRLMKLCEVFSVTPNDLLIDKKGGDSGN